MRQICIAITEQILSILRGIEHAVWLVVPGQLVCNTLRTAFKALQMYWHAVCLRQQDDKIVHFLFVLHERVAKP